MMAERFLFSVKEDGHSDQHAKDNETQMTNGSLKEVRFFDEDLS